MLQRHRCAAPSATSIKKALWERQPEVNHNSRSFSTTLPDDCEFVVNRNEVMLMTQPSEERVELRRIR